MVLMSNVLLGLGFVSFTAASITLPRGTCDSVYQGYQCRPEISQNWGQYSPWFSVPSNISPDTPPQCVVTFAQILSRHGARDPTAKKSGDYNSTINKIHSNVKDYAPEYAFIRDYSYTLGSDQLTLFGAQELINSGINFYTRYTQLSSQTDPFVRASGEDRVVQSAYNWTKGFHQAKTSSGLADPQYPYPVLVISEAPGSNNTLNHGLCSAFENGSDSRIASSAQAKWATLFVPAIQDRFNKKLPGANLSSTDAVNIMDLCPYNTVASADGQVSPFCDLLNVTEWQQYGYYQSLNKFYGDGAGNPLGPTQGVGFVNELIARLTGKPVMDHTSVNHTLDDNPTTFPLNRTLYADFSHDNDMTTVFFAMGLYNSTKPLSNTTLQTVQDTDGYSSSYTVPFAARAYVEKLNCIDHPAEEMVRVIVNDRVIPLQSCGSDALGRCSLGSFINSLTFASNGGDWGQCFTVSGSVHKEAEVVLN